MDKKDGRPPDGASSSPRNEQPPAFSVDPAAAPDAGPPTDPEPGDPPQAIARARLVTENRSRLNAYVEREHDDFVRQCQGMVRLACLAQNARDASLIADEIADTAYASALESIDTYDPAVKSFALWMLDFATAALKRECARRRKQKAREVSLDAPRRGGPDHYGPGLRFLDRLAALGAAAASEDDAARAESDFYHLISKLTDPDYRDALDLRFRLGLSEREISIRMGITYCAVRKRIERAKKMLFALTQEALDA